jgi:Tol biopolymer transport system component
VRIVFASAATNLVAGDNNGYLDVFVRDMTAGTTSLVSTDLSGNVGNGDSGFTQLSLSADGHFAAFASGASNLVAGDTNNVGDVFVRDLLAGSTVRVSVTNGTSQGNGTSFSPTISGTGRYVVFTSVATNLVTGDTNGQNDVFVRDTLSGTTTRVSVDSSSKQGNGRSGGSNDGWGACGISDNGRFVAFQSSANNLIGNGKDKNNVQDVFLRDLLLGKTTMVSVTPANKPANGMSDGPSMSAAGLIMFCSYATNLVADDANGKMDVFVRPAQ